MLRIFQFADHTSKNMVIAPQPASDLMRKAPDCIFEQSHGKPFQEWQDGLQLGD